MTAKINDEKIMTRALKLAQKGIGHTSPNPAVGCAIVKNGEIIAGDYHHKAGSSHAEILALKKAGNAAKGSDLYVTLEPCCIYGRTPPCTEAIIKAGIKRVVIGTLDPNPSVNGKGVKCLQEAGIEVEHGILQQQCEEINRGYNKYITTGLPYVTIKYAQSLDGRIATSTCSSQWISGEKSLKFAHQLRVKYDAVLIGAHTANIDDPQLTVRKARGKNPIRILLTDSGRLNNNLRLLADNNAQTIIATSRKGFTQCRGESFEKANIITLPVKSNGLDLKALLRKLGDKNITSLLVEGGSKVITSFLKQKLADSIIVITAPIIIGEGISAINDLDIKTIDSSIKLINKKMIKLSPDYVICGDIK
ncbi:MAG: bifunctional diaminohydroxyphosphoribosylaminopyrimidine deaminase/5-amino-6-(5-phosphoribosylamino)uracil reductase RibD [candidate division Zixibacteria bacterium]|nr:bifunctional diaminohydroxyphosphoribosylaminopyrimidine deaminase/5-amino-6-(5-phosphoribosylamino)uracil reductase RibD [candidate division Zixibacteria bacterium]